MKKAYKAPEIMFEDFSLSTNIAGDCDVIVNNHTENVCAYISRTGEHVFTEAITACKTKQGDGANNGVCYHVPIETNDLFNS